MSVKYYFVILAFFSASSVFADMGRIYDQPAQDIFVRWKPFTIEQQRNIHEELGTTVMWRSGLVEGLERLSVKSIENLDLTLRQLSENPAVIYAEPNYRIFRVLPDVGVESPGWGKFEPFSLFFQSAPSFNDEFYDYQWALNAPDGINPQGAWAITTGSSAIRVAVIDTGAQANHSDLVGRITDGYDAIQNINQVVDTHGHGTHVSGIIGALTNNKIGIAGINSQITIIPIRAVPDRGDETDADIIEAFEFAVKAGARVANCSFGKKKSGLAVDDTIEAAGKAGLLTVVAAGNGNAIGVGQDLNKNPSYPASFRTNNMIVVAASDRNNQLADFSNYGLGMVDVAAPGTFIYSTFKDNQYRPMAGTSMAAPQVAGIAALVLAAKPTLTTDELKNIILRTAVPVPAYATKLVTGGKVDASAAVKAAVETGL